MSSKVRLQTLSPLLKARGVRSVKLSFAPAVDSMPVSVACDRVYALMESYLKGRLTRVDRIGDAPLEMPGVVGRADVAHNSVFAA